MTGFRVAAAKVRGILDSRARVTVEADVTLDGGAAGRGSAPVAIAPGRRERRRSEGLSLGPDAGSAAAGDLCRVLTGSEFDATEELDRALGELARAAGAGADVTLALSVAAWRASAVAAGLPLHRHLAIAAGSAPALPHPLVNVFSGGIHRDPVASSFQQVMAAPELASPHEDVEAALAVFDEIELRLGARGERPELSASSGFLVGPSSVQGPLAELADALDRCAPGGAVGLGVDVAAEHLSSGDGRYRLDGRLLSGGELLELLTQLVADFDVVYLEDPFGPEDEELWRALRVDLPPRTCLVGDDLFATDAKRVDGSLAGGIVLKPIQAGTVTATVEAARAARAANMELCLSHRSGETEDTFVCDLATALGARFQKVGGPRRGDRIAKYNQLLRLAEDPALVAAETAPEEVPLTTLEGI